jgi:hypothetical protein
LIAKSKPFWQSKTILVNSLTLAASVIALVAGSDLIADHPGLTAALGVVLGGVNLVLRFVTSKPIDFD